MNNKGITVTSLIIYVIGMVIIIGVISTLTTYFYKNIDMGSINDDNTQYTKFSSMFVEEINKQNNQIIDCKTSEESGMKISYIVFASGNQYTFNQQNKSIYKNKIRICQNVEDCEFIKNEEENTLKVNFKTKSLDMTNDNAITYNLKK